MITWMEISPSPIALRDLLRAHHLFPDTMEEPLLLIRYANMTKVGYLGPDDAPQVVFLESKLDRSINLIQVIVKDKEMHQSEAVLEVAGLLHDRWFNQQGLHRVEARVECDRTSTAKFLKALGFHQETAPSGIRGAYLRDGGLVNIHVYGLLPEDKPRFRLKPAKLSDTIITEGVTHERV